MSYSQTENYEMPTEKSTHHWVKFYSALVENQSTVWSQNYDFES